MALVLTLNTIICDKLIFNGVIRLSIRRNFFFNSLTFQHFSCFFPETAKTAPQTICVRPSSVCNVLTNVVFDSPLRIIALCQRMGRTSSPQRTDIINYSLFKIVTLDPFSYWLYGTLWCFVGRTQKHSHYFLFEKLCQNVLAV